MRQRYRSGDPELASFFGGPWQSSAQLQEWAGNGHQWDRAALAQQLLLAAQATGGSTQALAVAKGISHPRSTFIVCGQQPAYGGGPLYSLVKAAQAIAIANELHSEEAPCYALFWCASEDHDADEANHCDLIAADGRIQRQRMVFSQTGAAIRYQTIGDSLNQLCRILDDADGSHLGRDFCTDFAAKTDEQLGAWQCRLMHSLFAQHRFIALESHYFRPLYRNALYRSVERWPADELAQTATRALAAGFQTAFPDLQAPPLFHDTPQERRAITAEQVHGLAIEDISPGAAIRPILQQAAIPARAFVGGPVEWNYHSFLRPIYAAAAVPMPLFVPRSSVTLIGSRVARGLERLGITAKDLAPEKPLPQLNTSPELDLSALDQAIAHLTDQAWDDDSRKRLEQASAALHQERTRLHNSIQRGNRRRLGLPNAGQLRDQLYPRGKPQDRVLSCFQALWQFGPGVASELVTSLHGHPAAEAVFNYVDG